MGILKRVIVSPAVYPRFLEIARGLSAIVELLVKSIYTYGLGLLPPANVVW